MPMPSLSVRDMLFAVPFGALADRVGRKKILLLAVCGMFMNDAWIRLVCTCSTLVDMH